MWLIVRTFELDGVSEVDTAHGCFIGQYGQVLFILVFQDALRINALCAQ